VGKVQLTTKYTVKHALVLQEDTEVEELTELEPTPKKVGRGLKRSYVVADFLALTAGGKYGQKALEEEYKLVTECESDALKLEDILDSDDDDLTPKKKKPKTAKVAVREAVGSSCQQPKPRRELNKVGISSCHWLSDDPHLKHDVLFDQICDDTNTCVYFSKMITTQLILNETTLFWYNISSTKTGKTKYGPIANWAAQVRNFSKIM
jgi:hypothetical protein